MKHKIQKKNAIANIVYDDKVASIQKKIKNLEAKKVLLKKQYAEAIKQSQIQCMHCNEFITIGETTFIHTYHWDNEAYCEGYAEGEKQFHCYKCDCVNRLFNSSYNTAEQKENTKELINLSDYFKQQVRINDHDDGKIRPWP